MKLKIEINESEKWLEKMYILKALFKIKNIYSINKSF